MYQLNNIYPGLGLKILKGLELSSFLASIGLILISDKISSRVSSLSIFLASPCLFKILYTVAAHTILPNSLASLAGPYVGYFFAIARTFSTIFSFVAFGITGVFLILSLSPSMP